MRVTNISDRELEIEAGPRNTGNFLVVPAGGTVGVAHETAYGWPADEENDLCAMGGLLDQPSNWALAEPAPAEPEVDAAPASDVEG